MSDGDSGWAERVTGHTPALSADGVVQHKKLHVNQPPSIGVSALSPVDRVSTPPATNGRLSLRGYVGRLQAKARSAGRAIAGVHSPRLKHSLSDDMELGGFGLLNGTGPSPPNGWHSVVDTRGSGGHGRPPGKHRRVLSLRRVLALATATALLLLFLGARQSPRPEWQGFVGVRGMHFDADCRPFLIAGFNAHHLVTNVLVLPTNHRTPGNRKGRDIVREALRQASEAGLNVLRTFAHTTDDNFPFQSSPGEFNENTFRALDWLLDEARLHGLRVVLSFIDNWKYPGGVDQYVDWSLTAPQRTQARPRDEEGDSVFVVDNEEAKHYEVERHALFFNDTGAKELYKSYVRYIIGRRNSRTGQLYRDDPTILAWDLINEPRCETWRVPDCIQRMQAWIEEMAAYVKALDPNHLVTVGAEGFWGPGADMEEANPGGWALQCGQNFSVNHAPSHIDFAAIHVWPDNWERTSESFQTGWVYSHLKEVERSLGKPLLLEEFGKKLSVAEYVNGSIPEKRDPVFQTMYHAVESAINKDRGLVGSLFWRWDVQVYAGSGVADYGVRQFDSTFGIIAGHAKRVRRRENARPPRQECRLGCWVRRKSSWLRRGCEHRPGVCSDYWDDVGRQVFINGSTASAAATIWPPGRKLQVWPTQAACCQPGLGAFRKGCSLTASLF